MGGFAVVGDRDGNPSKGASGKSPDDAAPSPLRQPADTNTADGAALVPGNNGALSDLSPPADPARASPTGSPETTTNKDTFLSTSAFWKNPNSSSTFKYHTYVIE